MTEPYVRIVRFTDGFGTVLPVATASLILLAAATIDWTIEGGSPAGIPYPWLVAVLLVANLVVTAVSPRWKRLLVKSLQKYVVNPPVRLSLRCRVPMGWCLLQSTGRRTGMRRTVPVGNGRVGTTLWVIAEHGDRAGYVHNIRTDSRVEVLIRTCGTRMEWVTGHAVVLDGDDPHARQWALIGWRHPWRLLNALTVRVLGTTLRTVRIDLDPAPFRGAPAGSR